MPSLWILILLLFFEWRLEWLLFLYFSSKFEESERRDDSDENQDKENDDDGDAGLKRRFWLNDAKDIDVAAVEVDSGWKVSL